MAHRPDLPDDDRPDGLLAVPFAGAWRTLGRLVPPADWFRALPRWADMMGLFAPSDYSPFSRLAYGLPAVNQGEIGSCTNGAARTGMELVRAIQGYDHVPISGTWAYAHNNRGVDKGAMISDVMKFAAESGLCRDELFPETAWLPSHARDLAACQADAPRFRFRDLYALRSFDEVVDAVARGYVVNLAVMVDPPYGTRFNRIDQDGCPGVVPGPGNHAVMVGYGLEKVRGEWMPWGRNSWGEDWPKPGAGSFFRYRRALWDCVSQMEAVAGRWVEADPKLPPLPDLIA